MASSIRPLHSILSQAHPTAVPPYPLSPLAMNPRLRALSPRLSFRCQSGGTRSSSSSAAIERVDEESRRSGKVRVRLRLDLQVQFGEHVVVMGSNKEFGAWRKQVPMEWTETGWVCELDLQGGEDVEFKFVILTKGEKGVIWEEGGNRVFSVPRTGVYDLVCRWNRTRDAMDLLAGKRVGKLEGEGDADGSNIEDHGFAEEAETSSFVEQWQGGHVSFMRSNEHRDREIDRRWDTSGLDGIALELVEGDRSSRNWWRKLMIASYISSQSSPKVTRYSTSGCIARSTSSACNGGRAESATVFQQRNRERVGTVSRPFNLCLNPT